MSLTYHRFRSKAELPGPWEYDPADFTNIESIELEEAQDVMSMLKKADTFIDLSTKVISRAEKGASIFDRFKNLFTGLVGSGGGANRTLDMLQNSANKAQDQFRVTLEMAKRVEGGAIKLKSMDDEIKFRDIAAMSGVYGVDGEGRARETKAIGKHIEIVIAKNKVSQISDRDIQRSLAQFMDKVSSNDYCQYG